jgi:beta-glucosidase
VQWGRTSETYGEDPFLASQVGVTATQVLQNRTANGFMQTAQVTRHYIGYHQASPDIPNAQETISVQWLHDQQLPVYEAFQVDGIAEGIMCGIAAFTSNAWNNSMIPNCVNEYLLTEQLRNQWNSSSFIQSDCCDSITAMYNVHKYFPTLEDAVAGALSAGLSASYGDYDTITAALTQGLTDGKVTEALLTTRIARNLLTRFRLGEFDGNNTANPFSITYNESLLDGATHRALAREAVTKTVVLLENAVGLLPLDVSTLPMNIAMIGPFADCQNTKGGCVTCSITVLAALD